jgi:hypothetical protein
MERGDEQRDAAQERRLELRALGVVVGAGVDVDVDLDRRGRAADVADEAQVQPVGVGDRRPR